MQKLLRDKLERDLGRPLERSSDRLSKSAAAETAIVPGGNIVPQEQEPEQVGVAPHNGVTSLFPPNPVAVGCLLI